MRNREMRDTANTIWMDVYNNYAEAGQPSRLEVEWRRIATVEVVDKSVRGTHKGRQRSRLVNYTIITRRPMIVKAEAKAAPGRVTDRGARWEGKCHRYSSSYRVKLA